MKEEVESKVRILSGLGEREAQLHECDGERMPGHTIRMMDKLESLKISVKDLMEKKEVRTGIID